MNPAIVWFENDLRMADHAALASAVAHGGPVVPVFVWSGGRGWADGAASRWWLHHSLERFSGDLSSRGLRLIIRTGEPEDILPELALESGADRVLWQEKPGPGRGRPELTRRLEAIGIRASIHGGALLHDPDLIRTVAGTPYRVFGPFHRRFSAELESVPLPTGTPAISDRHATPGLATETIASLGLLPRIDRIGGLGAAWNPGEHGGRTLLDRTAELTDYAASRDHPSMDGTSRLSPHLHFGEVSPRQVWHAASGNGALRRQLVWREFAHHLLHHHPETRHRPLRQDYERFPWQEDADALQRWQSGQTGYPIVDAGMRQLLEIGWMHNRVRMIAASFLTKDLLQSWLRGQEWFNDTLVDADLANNVMGWQWAAGCGADAQPFFRIFNPVLQGRKWDPNGAYVRRWVPELAAVPDHLIHEPWKSGTPNSGYPSPIVDHSRARTRALDAFAQLGRDPS